MTESYLFHNDILSNLVKKLSDNENKKVMELFEYYIRKFQFNNKILRFKYTIR